jgi:hypothetical protein
MVRELCGKEALCVYVYDCGSVPPLLKASCVHLCTWPGPRACMCAYMRACICVCMCVHACAGPRAHLAEQMSLPPLLAFFSAHQFRLMDLAQCPMVPIRGDCRPAPHATDMAGHSSAETVAILETSHLGSGPQWQLTPSASFSRCLLA